MTPEGDGPIRVLIADDQEEIRTALERLINDEPDMVLVGAADGAVAAAALAKRHRPDVAVLDVHMPGNGAEAARLLQESSVETRLIALTAYAEAKTLQDMRVYGMVQVLEKGIAIEEILEAIRAAVRD